MHVLVLKSVTPNSSYRLSKIIDILYSLPIKHTLIQRQYIFIHDCIMEILKIGETSMPIQALRRRHKELLLHDPHLDTSKMEAEYAVSGRG